MSTVPVKASDGRRARRDRNRDAVLDAVIALFSENIDPSPDEVARRSGLSPRSVYRYFEDRDELTRSAIDRQLEAIRPHFEIKSLGRGELSARISTIVNSRLTVFSLFGHTARAARLRASSNPAIAAQVRSGRELMRQQVSEQFAPELDRREVDDRLATLDACDSLLQIETLEYLVVVRAAQRSHVETTLSGALRSLLGDH